MLERLIGDWRQATITEIRLIAIAVAASVAATAAVGLACAALFAAVMERLGIVDACLAVAVVFLAVTLALLALYAVLRHRAAHAAAMARTHRRSLIADPLVVSTGLPLVQAVGLKRSLTLLAIVGGAMALASRPAARPEREVPGRE
jgi:ABC-type uncharacterized transport system permease subunit